MSNLEEKYGKLSKDDRQKLAQILRRKRLEQGLTLERIADGICSTSYLSKIENCLVDVDDSYYNLLFERLNIKYDDVVATRLVPLDIDILNCYLLNDLKRIQNYVESSLKDRLYTNVETELFVLLYNVLNNNFEEATMAIRKIDLIYRSLSDEELLFYQFIEALIAFKRCEYSVVYPKITELLNAKNGDDILKIAIVDLALDYFFVSNRVGPFYNLFIKFNNMPLSVKYQQITAKHQLQSLVNRYEDPDVELCFNIHLGSTDGKNISDYHYYYAYYLLRRKEYQKVYNHLIETKLNSDSLLLLAIAIDKLDNDNYKYDFLHHHLIVDKRYSENVKASLEYYIMKMQKFDQGYLLNYLRRMTNNRDFINPGNLIYEVLKEEYIKLSYYLGRYKEAVKTFLIME